MEFSEVRKPSLKCMALVLHGLPIDHQFVVGEDNKWLVTQNRFKLFYAKNKGEELALSGVIVLLILQTFSASGADEIFDTILYLS